MVLNNQQDTLNHVSDSTDSTRSTHAIKHEGWVERACFPLCDSPDSNGQASATNPSSSSVSGGVLLGMNMADETAIKSLVLLARYFTNYVLYFSSRRFGLKKNISWDRSHPFHQTDRQTDREYIYIPNLKIGCAQLLTYPVGKKVLSLFPLFTKSAQKKERMCWCNKLGPRNRPHSKAKRASFNSIKTENETRRKYMTDAIIFRTFSVRCTCQDASSHCLQASSYRTEFRPSLVS